MLIVEGQGEVMALPVLLRRLIAEHGLELEVVGRPWREPRQRMLVREHLRALLEVARARAEAALILLDADDDCAVAVASTLRTVCAELMPGLPVCVVVAVREFEAWFLAAAASLAGRRGLPADLRPPEEPEAVRDAKGWLSQRMPRRYSPTLDQPALAAEFDLAEAAKNARSFRKLVKDVRRLGAPSLGTPGMSGDV